PAPAEHDVDRLLGRDRLEAGIHLVDLDPHLVVFVVARGEPRVEGRGVLERADLCGIDLDRRHWPFGLRQSCAAAVITQSNAFGRGRTYTMPQWSGCQRALFQWQNSSATASCSGTSGKKLRRWR